LKYVLKTSTPRGSGLDLATDLNPQQRAVAEAPPGVLLVLAGAGTGKTRTLTYRVARLVKAGCDPSRIMLVTFTNRAAKEMVERVEGLLGIDMRMAAAGTFHHVGHRILRKHGGALGLSGDFGIIDPEDARDILSGVIAEEGMQALTAKRFPPVKVVARVLSMRHGTLRPTSDVVEDRFPQFMDHTEALERVSARYAQRKRALNVVDFDDLLSLWLQLLRDPTTEAVRDELQSAWDHMLVDEYQDINAMQGALIDAMSARHQSLTCVGDDAQSIYSFRGADFSQIHRFSARHAGAKVMRLTINYRSTPQVLALANRSIAQNREQHPKELSAVRGDGSSPAVLPLRDVYQQAEFVAQRTLEHVHDDGLALRQIAVLYRNHSHSLELQVELTRRQIPFAIRSGVRFFEQAHIKDVVAFLRARENPRDALAWVRLLRLWPGIGLATAERAARALGGHEGEAVGREDVPRVLAQLANDAKGRARPAFERIVRLWRLLTNPEQESPGKAIRAIVERHYSEYATRTFENADVRAEDLEHLAGYADRYRDATEFLSELALLAGITAENVVQGAEPDDKLVLSTIHQAKGLEWPVVFVLGLSEGKFPAPRALKSNHELEEERRLFYVASTRAKDELYLCYPTVEEGRDGPRRLLRPSRFLAELDRPPRVFERWEIEEVPED
jgi:DNA helicase-2/ATP-dependent DNA helicase PcrA